MKALICTLGVAALLSNGPAAAHTHLLQASPADGSSLQHTPPRLQLQFSEAALLTALSMQREGGAAPLKLPIPAGQAAATFSIVLPPLAPGKYRVTWRALSDDHHMSSGFIRFTLQSP